MVDGQTCTTTNECAIVTGKFSVQYLDSITGQDYTQFDFGNGSFQLNVTDGSSGGPAGDDFGLQLQRNDGSNFVPMGRTFYVSAGTAINPDGSAPEVPVGGGDITVHP
jgi:hypothetical protein